MSDTNETTTSTETASPGEQQKDDQARDVLGEPGKAALAAERKAAKDAQRELKAAQDRIAQFEAANQSETEKLTGKATAAEKAAADNEARAAKAERNLAVYLNAGDADPNRLLKNVDFLDAIAQVDPTDTEAITAAIKAAVKDSPWMLRTGRTGGDTGQGHGTPTTPVQPGPGRLAAAFDQQYTP